MKKLSFKVVPLVLLLTTLSIGACAEMKKCTSKKKNRTEKSSSDKCTSCGKSSCSSNCSSKK